MILKKHLEIFFKDITIADGINFFDLWNTTNEKTNTNKFDLNKPLTYKSNI